VLAHTNICILHTPVEQQEEILATWAPEGMARARFHALPVWVQKVWKNRKLSWGFEFLDRTRILSGIQFKKHLIDFIVVETKKFHRSIVNVILTRQTCGQHSSMSAGSKRRALGKFVSVQICYVLLM